MLDSHAPRGGAALFPLDDTASRIAEEVAVRGWSVCANFIPPEVVSYLRERLLEWWQEGELRKAGIGRGKSFQIREDIRGDFVRWLDTDVQGCFTEFLQTHYEPLRLAFNRELFLGLFDFEGHVTVYPPGKFYARHIDRFADAGHRKLSAILYLNDNWQPGDGGELRLYLPQDDGTEKIHDVNPAGGTLVTFLSHRIPHEVLPANRERYSLTGWFRVRQ